MMTINAHYDYTFHFLGLGSTHPDPSGLITLDDGTIVPKGEGTNSGVDRTSLLYNEYPLLLSVTLCVFC